MDTKKDNIDGSDGKRNGNFDCANKELVIHEIPIPEASLSDENKGKGERTTTTQATLSLPSTTETVVVDRPAVNNFSFASLSETKTTKSQGTAILEVAEQTTAYNVQVSSNNPATIEATSSALQPGQGEGSMIVIDQPDQVIIHENIQVKDSTKVQFGRNNVISSALTDNSQGSALVGATSAAARPPQLVIRRPGKVLLYSRKDIDGCDTVQIGDNNIMGKLIPQEDAFVRACCKLDINPESADDIFERLSDVTVRQQFATMMADRHNVTCSIKTATRGCILLELEVPTEEDRLQLLRMARDGTFQQVLLETFLPELAAEGRAVSMNLAIGVRNPPQDMVEELQGATASSNHEDVVVVKIPSAINSDPKASKQDQTESAEDSPKQSDESDVEDPTKDEEPPEDTDVDTSKTALYTADLPTLSKKLLPEADDGEGEIAVSVEGYAAEMPLGTGGAAADFPPEGFDDKFLTCDICQNIYEDPRVLPCGHTFCTRCLEKWRKRKSQFTCPTCRQEVTLQETGINSLPPNFHIKHLLDFRAQENKKVAYAQCQMCESGARVEGSCQDCPFFLCKNCITAHGKTPVLKDHHIILLDSPEEFCPKHTNLHLTFYCKPCTQFVCQACTETEHKPGPDHDPQKVSKVAQEYKTELQTLVGETQNKLKGTEYILTKELMSLRRNCEIEGEKIREHFAQLRTKLDQEEQQMTAKLMGMEVKQQDFLEQKRKDFEEALKPNEDRLQFCTDILARGSDIEILTLREQLEDNLNHLKTQEISYGGLGQQITFEDNRDRTFNCSPGTLKRHQTNIKITELLVESLPTTIIIFDDHLTSLHHSKAAPQITVVPPRLPENIYALHRLQNQLLLEGTYVTLDTTRISEGLFEAVWRPQTSGKHVVGITVRDKRPGYVAWYGGIWGLPRTVDVGSNNPVLRFGQNGSQQGQVERPRDVAVRGDRLYVADAGNNQVQVFDLSGNFCFSFPTTGSPAGLAVQTDGTILVNCHEEVMKFSPSGEMLHKFPLGEYCISPYGLAVQRDGRVVVAEPGKHSIFLFEADGTLVKQVGGLGKGEGQLNRPCFVCVDKEDNIIVADTGNSRVQVFDKNLNFLHRFGAKGSQPQDMCYPMGVSADSRGNIVLANIGKTIDETVQGVNIQVFRPDGTWVSTISSDGDKLNRPHGMAVTEDGHVFVADTKDHCIRKYRYM